MLGRVNDGDILDRMDVYNVGPMGVNPVKLLWTSQLLSFSITWLMMLLIAVIPATLDTSDG